MTYRKKLIEVALPLEAINKESAREKSIRHGHPSTLHLWWARRPLAACRAVLWASLVDDPSSWPERFPTEEDQKRERQRLFDILGRIVVETDKKGKQTQVVRGLVSWNDVNEVGPNGYAPILEEAQREIARCLAWDRGEEPPTKPDAVREYIAKYAPPAYDPFAGGGSIPLEAQRLGLEAHASDLNPVAVLINKALIEIPPKFKDQPPVNPEDRQQIRTWQGAQGLAADVRYYGQWMRDEAFKRIGHLYPKVKAVREEDGSYRHATESDIQNPKSKVEERTVIAWLWARTVKCPNPACGCQMPLSRSFALSNRKGLTAQIVPNIDRHANPPRICFNVTSGKSGASSGTISRKGATCLVCDTPVPFEYIRINGQANKISVQLMAIVAEGTSGRVFLPPLESHEKIAIESQSSWEPVTELPGQALGFRVQLYGITKHAQLFSSRQLTALSAFGQVLGDVPKKIGNDFKEAKSDYINAISTYLALGLSKASDLASSLCHWQPNPEHLKIAPTFSRHALAMSWDFAEGNPFSESSGNFLRQWELIDKVLQNTFASVPALALQCDAALLETKSSFIFSTDPPYYDNISYADLSDFFYIWLRNYLIDIYPDLFNTLLVPKLQELVAEPFRHGGRNKAQSFFEKGLQKVFSKINKFQNFQYPLTIYYAFKQSEEDLKDNSGASMVASTGWETILEGLIREDFSINGTWPVRTERSGRMRDFGSNALASSIVLVCRPRPTDAAKITRRQFLSELKHELPKALKTLQQGNVAPVDLAQASIGPGMAIFSQYAAVLENDGSPMRVRTALQLINQILDEFLTEQEGEFDGDTRWALTWFEQHQFDPGQFGDAETLSKAKNTSVQGMVDAGILEAKAGKVRLLKRDELKSDWNPNSDSRMPDWEVAQYLIHELDQNGETGAAELLAKLGDRGEAARDLAYRLYSLCDRKGWAQEGIAYNSLVISWPEITRLASEIERSKPVQGDLGF